MSDISNWLQELGLSKYLEVFEENEIDYKEIISVEGNILSKIVNLIYLLDYSSIYNSILNKIDPSPVKSIEYIKDRISINWIYFM